MSPHPETGWGMKLIDDWKSEFHRLWTVRVALFMFVLTGALIALPAFAEILNPRFLLVLCCGGYGLLGYLRLVKQAPKVDL